MEPKQITAIINEWKNLIRELESLRFELDQNTFKLSSLPHLSQDRIYLDELITEESNLLVEFIQQINYEKVFKVYKWRLISLEPEILDESIVLNTCYTEKEAENLIIDYEKEKENEIEELKSRNLPKEEFLRKLFDLDWKFRMVIRYE